MRDFLISKKSLVKFMWDQSYDLCRAFKQEEVWIGYAWPDAVGYATAAGMDVVYMQPKEGRISWYCGFGMFAEHAELLPRARRTSDSWTSTKAAEFLLSLLLLRAHEHGGGSLAAPGGHREGVQPRRSDRCSSEPKAHAESSDPAPGRVQRVLERGHGGPEPATRPAR